jgi:hypothetical protein
MKPNPLVRLLFVDGTTSCGRMTVYRPDALHQQIHSEAQWFLARAVTFNPKTRTVELPDIFQWSAAAAAGARPRR